MSYFYKMMKKAKRYTNGLVFALILGACMIQLAGIAQAQPLSLPTALQGKIPFDFEALATAPAFRWENKKDSVWSLFYEGEKFNGKQTEVFAYYASPATLSGKKAKGEKYPAVVMLHGGGGTAFPIWVREWAKKGYAAIAMDLGGAKPLPEAEQESPWSSKSDLLPNGAPDDTDVHKFYSIDKDFTEQWQFHAVANIIRAHSLIRSLADTDSAKTALTGISWGGYLTNIVAGIDHRFKAAVPVYGCGFLQEKSAWVSRFDSLGLETSKKWMALWEPSSYVGNAQMPMLFVNGTNDFAYDVESWQKTVDLAPNAYQLLIHEMGHNHELGAEPGEIEAFIENIFTKSIALPLLGIPKKIGKWYEATIGQMGSITKAQFIYTEEIGNNKERKWITVPAQLKRNRLMAEGGHKIKMAYFLLTDAEGLRYSSPVLMN